MAKKTEEKKRVHREMVWMGQATNDFTGEEWYDLLEVWHLPDGSFTIIASSYTVVASCYAALYADGGEGISTRERSDEITTAEDFIAGFSNCKNSITQALGEEEKESWPPSLRPRLLPKRLKKRDPSLFKEVTRLLKKEKKPAHR